MSPRTPGWSEAVHAFLLRQGLREHPALAALRAATDRLPQGAMRSSAEQMQLLAFLLELASASRVLEIGCFTGYGTLAMALALPPHGRVVSLERDARFPEIGRRYWREAGVEERIELVLGDAVLALDRLVASGAAESFDFVYIDADKKRYPLYLERALVLLREGGIVAADNVLLEGAIADPQVRSRRVEAVRTFLARVRADPRLAFCTLPIGDGLALLRKRPRADRG
ncbi:Putative O-methyltransferase [bacterium HR40]|nr:Putative O-methyltransferase [bacterium HR40]